MLLYEKSMKGWIIALVAILSITAVFPVISQAYTDEYEENDYSYEAAYITEGTYYLYCDDYDWFKIYLDYGDSIYVSISFDDSLADLDMNLYDPYMNKVDFSEGSGGYEEVYVYYVSDSGYYYIEVFPFEGEATYTMEISTTNSYGISETNLPAKWNPGDGWGYKWEMDMGDIARAISDVSAFDTNTSVSTTASGDIISVLYIEYKGEDSDGYRFMYEGRVFTKEARLTIHMSYGSESYDSSYSYESNIWITKVDFNYYGYFWLKGYEKNGIQYYGIVKQSINEMTCVIDMDMSMEGTSDYGPMKMDMSFNYELTISGFEITYSPAIPYLPYEDVSCSVTIDSPEISYSGHVEGSYSYNIEGNMPYLSNISDSGSVNTDLIDEEEVYMEARLDYDSSTKIAEKPMPILGTSNMIFPNPVSGTGEESIQVNGYFATSSNKGRFSDNFYHKMTPSGISGTSMGSSTPTSPDEWSKSATKSDIESIRNAEDPLGGFPVWMLGIIILVAVGVILLTILYMRRRRRAQEMPPPGYPAPYAEKERYGPEREHGQMFPQEPPDHPSGDNRYAETGEDLY